MFGNDRNRFCLDAKGLGAETRTITANLSTRYSGYYVPARHDGIYRPITVVGKTRNVVFVDGGTKVFGRPFWKR